MATVKSNLGRLLAQGDLWLVVGLFGTILLLTSFESKRVVRHDLRLTPTFGPNYAGAAFSGAF